jgi:hypothetical protein
LVCAREAEVEQLVESEISTGMVSQSRWKIVGVTELVVAQVLDLVGAVEVVGHPASAVLVILAARCFVEGRCWRLDEKEVGQDLKEYEKVVAV